MENNQSESQPTASQEEQAKLYRAPNDGFLNLSGVSAGIADFVSARYFELDPIYVKFGFVALTMFGFFFVPIIYLILWLVLPLEGEEEQTLSERAKTNWTEVKEKLTSIFEQVKEQIMGLGLTN